MKLSNILGLGIVTLAIQLSTATAQEIHIEKLVLNKNEKKIFRDRDSSATVYIDTLIMKDRSSLHFLGKKDVKLVVQYAEIGNNTYFLGEAGQNNASNFDIDVHFEKLGSLQIAARGKDATNGTKTYPNGDAGNVNLVYSSTDIKPQSTNKKDKHYLSVDVRPGGLHVTPTSELSNIYSQIKRAPAGLRGLPQGQIYSGSPGKEGTVNIKSKNEL